MTEIQEVAQGMLANYRAWLAAGKNLNTRAWALAFVCQDEIMKEESPGMRQAIADALFDAARAPVSELTRAALSDLHAHMAVAGVPDRPIDGPMSDVELNQAAREAGFSVVPHGSFWLAKNPQGGNISAPLSCNHEAWAQVRRVHGEMSHTEQTERDAYWTAHAKALELSKGAHGTFAALIGEAFTRADKRNAARLIAAFPHLFT